MMVSLGQKVTGNQPNVDEPPSTIQWYKPLAGGTLKLLVILPENSLNEVDELAKQLDMNAKRYSNRITPDVANYVRRSDPRLGK